MSSVRRTFASLGVPSHFSGRLAKSGIVWPTAVQRAALDALLPRTASQPATPARSALLRWPTGSGKTLAYALPMLSRLSKNATGVQAEHLTPALTQLSPSRSPTLTQPHPNLTLTQP